jgi:hypothetical protein
MKTTWHIDQPAHQPIPDSDWHAWLKGPPGFVNIQIESRITIEAAANDYLAAMIRGLNEADGLAKARAVIKGEG